ncbi:SufS family cysteine desulfurase [Thalassotalea sp. PS06]|uniref:SufS family cysteine desulfurase n=1 Tax=Thalassotalea sp. PS06 TaxID=2594005 RepID=UPI00116507CD|nr:SufS family cysteine desulfurase [Thalassotalea sp. PS06]QDP01521.1 SufS family cysteine desulfurase [Thalassotalea sp. PS06]
MSDFSLPEFRQQFPILQELIHGKSLIYFDNAATTQKPLPVLQAVTTQLKLTNANVHRGAHHLSAKATTLYETAREKVAAFIKAPSKEQIIWTKGTTEAINLLSSSLASGILPGDEIAISVAEHHANIVPWQQLALRKKAKLVVLPIDEQGRIDEDKALSMINEKTKLLCINHASNVLGKLNPVELLFSKAKQVNALTVLDAAQTIAHVPIDVQRLDLDFMVFSAHKMFGPAGLGVLYGRKSLLESMPPYQYGGEMIKHVSFERTEFNELPHKFEAGTPNITGVIAMAACIDFLQSKAYQQSLKFEKKLVEYAWQQLNTIEDIQWLVKGCPDLPIFSFTLASEHHQDLAAFLDSQGVAVRSGHHCAMPLMQYFNIPGSVRISLAPYNTFEEVDFVSEAIRQFIAGESSADEFSEELANALAISGSELTENKSWQDIKAKFAAAKGWDAKHREIMLLGKALPRMAKSERSEQTLIAGCESEAWLKVENHQQGTLTFIADSDARVIRGLLNIILTLVNGQKSEQILNLDFEPVFEELGLMQHLSPSRGNGLLAIVKRIKQLAAKS